MPVNSSSRQHPQLSVGHIEGLPRSNHLGKAARIIHGPRSVQIQGVQNRRGWAVKLSPCQQHIHVIIDEVLVAAGQLATWGATSASAIASAKDACVAEGQ